MFMFHQVVARGLDLVVQLVMVVLLEGLVQGVAPP